MGASVSCFPRLGDEQPIASELPIAEQLPTNLPIRRAYFIIGSPGSGKEAFCLKLAQLLGYQYISVDHFGLPADANSKTIVLRIREQLVSQYQPSVDRIVLM